MLRLKEPVALFDETTGAHVAPKLSQLFSEDDPLVKQHRWAFATEEELAALNEENSKIVESVEIEQATRRPGERSRARRK